MRSAIPPPARRASVARSRLVATWALVLGLLAPARALAQVAEWDMKAAFIYNFAKFVQWPAGAFDDGRSALVIGVLGTDPIGEALDRVVQGKKVNGRLVQVRHGRSLADLGRCQIVFVGGSEEAHAADVLGALAGTSAVTVGDMDEFVQAGGILQIALIQNRVRFAINTARAERVGLKISSKVLTLSRIVVSRF